MAEKEKKSVRVDRSLVAVPRVRMRRKRIRRFVERAGKGVLLVAGAGALAALLANLDDIKNSKEVRDHWWLLPLGVVAIGYMLRKRGNPYGSAVIAVGGALFASAYAVHSKEARAETKQQTTPQIPPPSSPKTGDTKGPDVPRFFMSTGSNAGWIQMPNGEVIRVPVLQA